MQGLPDRRVDDGSDRGRFTAVLAFRENGYRRESARRHAQLTWEPAKMIPGYLLGSPDQEASAGSEEKSGQPVF